jgi:hypothetical protein
MFKKRCSQSAQTEKYGPFAHCVPQDSHASSLAWLRTQSFGVVVQIVRRSMHWCFRLVERIYRAAPHHRRTVRGRVPVSEFGELHVLFRAVFFC